jgi:hypothetical protein
MRSDTFLKIAIAIAVLLAGGGVFYHYVVFVPAVEKKKEDRADQERIEAAIRLEEKKLEEEKKRRQAQAAYNACQVNARTNYEGNWATACKSVAESQAISLQNCLRDRSIMSNPYMGEAWCRKSYGSGNPSGDCTLPRARADSINKTYESEQERCLAESRAGLR